MEPIVFTPLYMERVWGGRSLETVYGRPLPDQSTPFGESWEMSDRENEQSIVSEGRYKGMTLNSLWNDCKSEVFGDSMPVSNRFPLLIKVLDAQQDLSVQVHPPKQIAGRLGGEPKTEMWYIADAQQDSKLYVGVKRGVNEQLFQEAINDGTVADRIHTIVPKTGESIHIESGRLHAIGAGLMIYEIQQNSDTTYRVFDWNRVGLDGSPRQLHVEESMACIDFDDVEPNMDQPEGTTLSSCVHFRVDEKSRLKGESMRQETLTQFAIITIISGVVKSEEGLTFKAGDFFILPVGASWLSVLEDVTYLETVIPV